MFRFEIGSRVKIVGVVAEYYPGVTAVVTAVNGHPQGLPHLNLYTVRIADGDDTFFEFQLAPAREEPARNRA